MKTIAIGGTYYGKHNIGDDAILYSIVKDLHENYKIKANTFETSYIDREFPDIEKRIVNTIYCRPKLGLFVEQRKKLVTNFMKVYKDLMFFKSCDLYMCGGGTILSDCPWHALRTVRLAGKVRIPVIMWGVGIAEGTDDKTNRFITDTLNEKYVKYIFTRDELVARRLVNMGIDRKKVLISYDPAIMLEGEEVDFSLFLSNNQIKLYKNEKRNICVTLSGEDDIYKDTPIDLLGNVINTIQKKYDANIFLIPTGCGSHCKDIEFGIEICKKCDNQRITAVKKEFTPSGVVEFLKSFSLVISSRLHMNIFAACVSVPSIGLVRNSKNIDFAKLMKLPYLEFNNLTESELIDTVDLIFNNYDYYKRNITDEVQLMRKAYHKALMDVLEYIKGLSV